MTKEEKDDYHNKILELLPPQFRSEFRSGLIKMSLKAEVIARTLVMSRTQLLEVLTAPGWMALSNRDPNLSMAAQLERRAAEERAQDYIYRAIVVLLTDPRGFE